MSITSKKFVGQVATVFNGAGFVSKNIIGRLVKHGTQVVIAHRGSGYDESKAVVGGQLGQFYPTWYNLKDEDSLRNAMQHSNIVINTVGKEQATKNFSLMDVNCEGPRRMARIARECGVQKFIHISALNAQPDPPPQVLKKGSQFLKSKYYGELAVREEFPNAIIFRPADIVGEADDFINHYTSMLRARFTYKMAIWDYYDDVVKQPVWIGDLVQAVQNAITDDTADGKTFQAVGPHRYDFMELIEFIRACGGQGQKYDTCDITNLRWDFGMRALITISSKLWKYPFCTWERVERDCISDYVDPKLPTLQDLGVKLTPIEPLILRLAYYRPREHRVEIPYGSAPEIDLPRKLNLQN